jgi:hypothetical protein
MKSKPVDQKKKGRPSDMPKDASLPDTTLESYRDIKNRAPTIIKTWQELMEGERDDDDSGGESAD